MQSVKRFKPYLLAVSLVTAWGVAAMFWMGSEDGSSGFSTLGWTLVPFVMPGAYLIAHLKGSLSNTDFPLIFGISWLAYSLLALAITHIALVIRKNFCKRFRTAEKVAEANH